MAVALELGPLPQAHEWGFVISHGQSLISSIFPRFRRLARKHEDVVKRAIGGYPALGHAKVLDNAIVGFVLNHPERFVKSRARAEQPARTMRRLPC